MPYESRLIVAAARGQFGSPGRGTSDVGSRYLRTDEGTPDQDGSLRAVVNWIMCE